MKLAFLSPNPQVLSSAEKKHKNKGFLTVIFFHFVALLMVISFTQLILSGKVDEGDVRSTSWLTAANIDK